MQIKVIHETNGRLAVEYNPFSDEAIGIAEDYMFHVEYKKGQSNYREANIKELPIQYATGFSSSVALLTGEFEDEDDYCLATIPIEEDVDPDDVDASYDLVGTRPGKVHLIKPFFWDLYLISGNNVNTASFMLENDDGWGDLAEDIDELTVFSHDGSFVSVAGCAKVCVCEREALRRPLYISRSSVFLCH